MDEYNNESMIYSNLENEIINENKIQIKLMKNILKKNEDQKLIENQEEIIKNFKY